jgi:hypothetical protein
MPPAPRTRGTPKGNKLSRSCPPGRRRQPKGDAIFEMRARFRKGLAATLLPLAATILLAGAASGSEEAEVLSRLAPALSKTAITEALAAMRCAKAKGIATEAERLAIIDYTRSSMQHRLWVFDLKHKQVLFEELVAHGKKSGDDVPTSFSNRNGSHQSSLGLFLTDETYEGGHGSSLKLLGLNRGLNDAALERKIVMHGADYVDPEVAQKLGRLGRSYGCPAVRREVAQPVIDTLKEGQFLYAYGPGSAAARKCDLVTLAANEHTLILAHNSER